MQPQIETLAARKLVGRRIQMSYNKNKTQELWQGFMPERKTIPHQIGTNLFSVEVYPNPSFFQTFNPSANIEKWAAIEVTNFNNVPPNMETLLLPGGLYAIFTYRGKASEAFNFFGHIYTIWLPNTNFALDNRPHFAIMGEKYKNEDPDSEEEIVIPIKKQQ